MLHATLSLDPNHAESWCQLGFVLLESGREEDARVALERATLLDPLYAKAWFELHRAVFDADRPAAAIDAPRRPGTKEPSRPRSSR